MQVIFSDETYVDVGEVRGQFVRRGSNERLRPIHYQTHRPFRQRVLFWGCFTARGPGPLVRIEGAMRTQNYIDTLSTHLIPFLTTQFSSDGAIFQQDNAPCHKSKATLDFLRCQNFQVLPWPPYSPDLNPIENLWAIVKRRIEKIPRDTTASVEAATHNEWNDTLAEICRDLVASMPRRIQECIKNKGGNTSY